MRTMNYCTSPGLSRPGLKSTAGRLALICGTMIASLFACTSSQCPSVQDEGMTARFADDQCLKSLFLPAKLSLPHLSPYRPTYWEIRRDESGLSIDGQLVPRSGPALPVLKFRATRLSAPGVDVTSGVPRFETISGTRVKFDGNPGSRYATWTTGSVFYEVSATGSPYEVGATATILVPDAELESTMRPIVIDTIQAH